MIIKNLSKAFVDFFSDKNRVRISKKDVETLCMSLSKKVLKDYDPDIIISIKHGGTTPGIIMAKILSKPIIFIVLKRTINITRMYNKDPFFIRVFMSIKHHYLFHTTKPKMISGIDENITGKKILIVDDAVHTGSTLNTANKYLLKEKGVSCVKVATLSYVSIKKPNYNILKKGNYCFPWSKDFIDDESNL
jgi:hypoxanthine phosphoribosyltransferase